MDRSSSLKTFFLLYIFVFTLKNYFMCVDVCLHVCLCIVWLPGDPAGQKRASDPFALELQWLWLPLVLETKAGSQKEARALTQLRCLPSPPSLCLGGSLWSLSTKSLQDNLAGLTDLPASISWMLGLKSRLLHSCLCNIVNTVLFGLLKYVSK